jgi:NAD(P)H dehydrogenase (quinone)
MADVNVLIAFYSRNGSTEALAKGIAEGAKSEGAEVRLRRAREIVGPEIMSKAPGWAENAARMNELYPAPSEEDAEWADAIIFGTPTRFGNMAAQMRNFLDQTGGLWASGALVGKVGSAFTSTATQHGGQETTLMAIHTNLLHFGMVLVGLPYSFAGQMRLDEVTGGAPYGATTIAGGDGSRQPSENELEGARFQGRLVAETANKLFG